MFSARRKRESQGSVHAVHDRWRASLQQRRKLKCEEYKIKCRVFIILFSFLPLIAFSGQLYSFSNPEQKARWEFLLQQMRCVVCQNQTLAESSAPLAQDFKKNIYQQIVDGKSNQEILEYFTARYGDFVVFNPPWKPSTVALWLSPLLLLGGASMGLWVTRRRFYVD
ncbi:MAG: cytochrome c-type biogenesis protein CcmH [Legionellaceae bacterium]|nr:cytochrome c-type biogenesis protein CcmH [Legionellaceae bacterium]